MRDPPVTHQVIKSPAHAFRIDPQLPFARVTVPRLAYVIPFEQFLRVIDPVDGMPVDGQRVVRFVRRIFNPRVYDAGFASGFCVNEKNDITAYCSRRAQTSRIFSKWTRAELVLSKADGIRSFIAPLVIARTTTVRVFRLKYASFSTRGINTISRL